MTDATRRPDPWPVTVVGVTDEDDPRLASDPRGGLTAMPSEITLQLLRTSRGVTLGSALARRPELVAQIRRIEGIGVVRTSPIGGTVGPGGDHWLGFLAVARLPDPCPRPLDRLTSALRTFLEDRLSSSRVHLEQGRVEGAWCPGFSDLAIDGRKLAGLGLRLTAGWGLVRGVVAVSAPDREELKCLDACHLVFGPGLDHSRLTSLAELPGLAGTDRAAAIRLLGG
ncbi:MAG TPA: hypothetical protein VMW80_11630 [Candidatus Dormibacteraeota bacterium]|nr:hypothetical protein [Candidatus Dormibacteraeota bacterium]